MILPKHPLDAARHAQVRLVRSSLWRVNAGVGHGGLSTGPKTPAGRAAWSKRYKNWREKQSKERPIKRLIELAGLLE